MTTTHHHPQHPQVAALVERARRLTGDEARRLAAARDAGAAEAAEDAAWAAADAWSAWAAAVAAARDAWAAAVAAARDAGAAAVAAARDAGATARAAALALANRHLVGQHGFTQAHYDDLTRPWRTVIGPVHPDDGILLVEPTHGETP